MFCKMEGCGHRVFKTSTVTRHVGQSWYDHGICSCCAIEIFPNGNYRQSWACMKKIKEELALIKLHQDRNQII